MFRLLSDLRVSKKLGVIAFLFAVAMLAALGYYYQLVEQKTVRPAELAVKGVDYNLRVVRLQRAFDKYFLEVQKSVSGEDAGDFKAGHEEAYRLYDTLERDLRADFGDEVAKHMLEPISGNVELARGFGDDPYRHDYLDISNKLTSGFALTATIIGQQTHLFEREVEAARSASMIYRLALPVASWVNSYEIYSKAPKAGLSTRSVDEGSLEDLEDDLSDEDGSENLGDDDDMDDLGDDDDLQDPDDLTGADELSDPDEVDDDDDDEAAVGEVDAVEYDTGYDPEEYKIRRTIAENQLGGLGEKLEAFKSDLDGAQSGFFRVIKGYTLPNALDFNGEPGEAEQLSGQVFLYAEKIHGSLKAQAESQRRAGRAKQTFAVLVSLLVFALGLGLMLIISRSISLGIEKALTVARAIAVDGDLDVGAKYSLKRRDELGNLLDQMSSMCSSLSLTARQAGEIAAGNLGQASINIRSDKDQLGHALSHMLGSLKSQIAVTKDNAEQVADSAVKILGATSQVAATAIQMATSITEATTTAEEVRQTAVLSEQKARAVAESAKEAASASVAGQDRTRDALDEMDKLRKHIETISESVGRVSEQGQTIGSIISTVNDIAEQSNVLAVNASIEAAQAGEHGRGFAVVAQEVKSLAEESKTATAAVKTILADIERATSAAVSVASKGADAALVGVKKSQEAGGYIQDLGSRVVQAAQSSSQISASASQQLAGVDQVVDAMRSIKTGSGQIVDSVTQVKKAAEELSEVSERLRKSVATYKL